MDSEWWGIRKQNQLKELQIDTKNFVKELDQILKNFEVDGNVQEMISKLKKSIKEFQQID